MALNWTNKTNGVDDINADDFNELVDSIEKEFGKKINKEDGKGLSSNDFTDADKEKIKDSVKFKGKTQENLLPTENNNIGDVYKLENYLLSGKYIYKAWTDVDETVISDGYGFNFGESILSSDEDADDTSIVIPVNIYNNSYNKIGMCELLNAREIPLWVVNNSTVSLTLDEVYYIERADGKIPTDLEPTSVGYAIYNGESFDKFYTDETVDKKFAEVKEDYKNEIIQATDLKLIKKVTLEEDVTDVKFTFDKPLSEIVFFFNGNFDVAGSSKALCLRSDSGVWYMFYRTVSLSTSKKYYFAHAKEIRERLWETYVTKAFTSGLQGLDNSTTTAEVVISERGKNISRYVNDLNLFVANREHKFAIGTTIEIWGREEDENI